MKAKVDGKRKWKDIGIFGTFLLLQVKFGDSVSNGADDAVSIGTKTKVTMAINCSKEVGELNENRNFMIM